VEQSEWILIVVDNARIHHAKVVKEYCEENKIHLVYLPPYSPNLNPIELLRKMIKKEFRKIQRMNDDIEKSISSASELVKQRISKVCIENLVSVYY
jgi:transposase